MRGTGRASGKVILLGEHAVVYGAPALAAGIDRGARAEAVTGAGASVPRSVLRLGGAEIVAGEGDAGRALAALLAEGTALPPLSLGAESDLPPASGLGSSAAIGVAVARAAMAAAGSPADDAAAIARATAWERVFHGNPSGIDTAAAASGGCFRFTRAAGVTPLRPACPIHLVVGVSGTTASTKVMVEGLARLRADEPDRVNAALAAIAALVDDARAALEAGDLAALGRHMDENHRLLAALHLSTDRLEQLVALARGAGALGAKLTGKGGGGAVLALAASAEGCAPVLAAFRGAGYEAFATQVSTRTPA